MGGNLHAPRDMVGKGRQHNLPEGHELLGRGRRQRLQGLAGLTVLIRQVFRILSPLRSFKSRVLSSTL